MNNWVTADQHFSHKNIIRYTGRPFTSLENMHLALIRRWNEKVKPEDTVYVLGDFCLGNYSQFCQVVKELNGFLRIVPGGHDHRWILGYHQDFTARLENKVELLDPLVTLEVPEFKLKDRPGVIVLSHYALRIWDRSHYGSLHLYGHSHGTLPPLGRSMDVGIDTNNFYPYSLKDIIRILLTKPIHNAPKEQKG